MEVTTPQDLVGAAREDMGSPANRRDMAPHRPPLSSRELWYEAYERFLIQAEAQEPILLIMSGVLFWAIAAIFEGQTPAEFVIVRIMQLIFGVFGAFWIGSKLLGRMRTHA